MLLWMPLVYGQQIILAAPQTSNSFLFENDSTAINDSLVTDSLAFVYRKQKKFSLLDSIGNDTLLRLIIKPYQFINASVSQKQTIRRNLPTIKEIKMRPKPNAPWKFWVIIFIFAYIAFVRISNPNNFRVFMLSVFNLKLSDKIWEDQRSFFGFVILQLFAIYLFIAAIFINNQLEEKQILWVANYFIQFLLVFVLLMGVYLSKFALHAFLGLLLKMKKLSIGFVSNTISVNNFLALVIFPLIVFTVYYQNPIWSSVLAQSVVVVFFISIVYRVVRITLLSNRFFSFPKIYLFIYLCALEILPWFVIVKLLNSAAI